MGLVLRDAGRSDIDALLSIEKSCFQTDRLSRRAFYHALKSPVQAVKVAMIDDMPVGYAILHWRQTGQNARLYSLAVLERWRQQGIARRLIDNITGLAQEKGKTGLSLEVRAHQPELIGFYTNLGFSAVREKACFYEDGEAALLMSRPLFSSARSGDVQPVSQKRVKTIIVVSRSQDRAHLHKHIDLPADNEVLTASQFLNMTELQGKNFHIINLCPGEDYLGSGYYVSLISEARGNRTIPSVDTLSGLVSKRLYKNHLQMLSALLPHQKMPSLEGAVSEDKFSLEFYFGQTDQHWARHLCNQCYRLFPAPVLEVLIQRRKDRWEVSYVWPLSFTSVDEKDRPRFALALRQALSARFPHPALVRHSAFDLAVLVDRNETLPPSNSRALRQFFKAGQKMDIACTLIEKTDINKLASFDGLFIRTTTQLNHFSYEFALKAESLGLPVIDDPQSILRCSNKVYLKEALDRAHLRTPKSWLITQGNLGEMVKGLSFPIILKIPDGSFSRGMFKSDNAADFQQKASLLLEKSYVVLAQEFVPTAFDWRIGVLEGKALFACKYYMSRGHWQIYHHKANNKIMSGGFETVELDSVPEEVLDAAIRASLTVGNGLYGVDVKQVEGSPLIIEVNDNPNIDAAIEDQISGQALYQQIIESFYRRMQDQKLNRLNS